LAFVYVTGHRNPDLDSIGSAIGYAELKQRLNPQDEYRPVRLGPVNAQTAWALERSGAPLPELLDHVRLRVCDVMQQCAFVARHDDPVRGVGLAMAERRLDVVPVVDGAGALAGLVTERELARMYIRESRGPSTFAERPSRVGAIVDVLDGELVVGEADRQLTGRVWVAATDVDKMAELIREGDVLVVGNRPDAQRRGLDLGVGLLLLSHGTQLDSDLVAMAAERGTAVVGSPLDSYVTARMIQLAVPCETIMSADALTVTPQELLADVAERVKDVQYRAAIAVDRDRRPIGMVTRSDLVGPTPRSVLLVDHAEQAQSVIGVEEANIVEILDHHHIGSIETRLPVKATFDPVGSTATLVVERFRREGREPKGPTATILLAALMSDTVVLSSPTTTDRDRSVVAYLEELLGLDARAFGMEMFEASSDVSDVPAAELVTRDAKMYSSASGRELWIAQIETVGASLLARRDELMAAVEAARRDRDVDLFALMVTDILAKSTELLVTGDVAAAERAFDARGHDGRFELPGVMSRKKQVAPKLLSVL
jgi:manganese-dependent inorganic pyrophosphatase